MAESLSARIMHLIPQAMHMYHRLVLVVAPWEQAKRLRYEKWRNRQAPIIST